MHMKRQSSIHILPIHILPLDCTQYTKATSILHRSFYHEPPRQL